MGQNVFRFDETWSIFEPKTVVSKTFPKQDFTVLIYFCDINTLYYRVKLEIEISISGDSNKVENNQRPIKYQNGKVLVRVFFLSIFTNTIFLIK